MNGSKSYGLLPDLPFPRQDELLIPQALALCFEATRPLLGRLTRGLVGATPTVRQIQRQTSRIVWRRCPKQPTIHQTSLREWRLNTQKQICGPAARNTPVPDRKGVRISAYSKHKPLRLLASLGKALSGCRTTSLAPNFSFPPAYSSPPGWQKQIRGQIWSVTMYMHMARGLVGSI